MQETWVWSLVWEDPMCCRITKPTCHNFWACALEPARPNYRAHTPQLLKPVCPEPTLSSRRSHCKEKPEHCNKGPAQPKINMHSKDVTFNGEGRREWGGKFSDTSWEDPSHQRDMAWALMVCIPGQNRLARGNLPTPGVVTQARQKRRSQNSLGVWIKNLLKTILRPKQERIIWIKDKAVSSLGLHSTWCALHGPSHPHLY